MRCARCLAALSAVRHDRVLRGFHARLRAAGKRPLVARLAACMSRLVTLMNRLLNNPSFQPAG